MITRLGDEAALTFPEITALWPEWTPNHRLREQACALVVSQSTDAQNHQATFPNGEPEIQSERRVGALFDPRTRQRAYSDNAALIINEFAASDFGLQDDQFFDVVSIAEEAAAADELVAVPGGGQAERWRLSGNWLASQPRKDVLRDMLRSCGGRIRLQGDGKMRLRLPRKVAPTVTLTDADILLVPEFGAGSDLIDRFNTAATSYQDRALNFASTTSNEVQSAALVAEHGQAIRSEPVSAPFCPSHHQAQELAQIAIQRENAAVEISVQCNCGGLEAIGEFEIAIDAPLQALRGVWEVRGHALRFDGGFLVGVDLRLAQLVDPTYPVVSLQQQGTPPTVPVNSNPGDGIEAPQDFQAAGDGVETSSGVFSSGVTATWTAPTSDAVTPLLEYRAQAGEPTMWQPFPVDAEATSAQIGPLQNNGLYDLRLTYVGPNGAKGPQALIENVEALAAADAPNPPTGLTITDNGNQTAQVLVTASDTVSNRSTEIRRDGVLIFDQVTNPSQVIEITDACGAGTFTWTARSINVSGIPSDTEASATETIL